MAQNDTDVWPENDYQRAEVKVTSFYTPQTYYSI